MSRHSIALLVAPIGVGVLLAALAAAHVAAQTPGRLPSSLAGSPSGGLPGIRTTLDDDAEAAARMGRAKAPKRPRRTDTEPVGQVPSFAIPPGRGAGKTGFVSTKTRIKAKPRFGTAATAGPSPGPPLALSPSGTVITPDRAVMAPDRAAAAPDRAAAAADRPASGDKSPQPAPPAPPARGKAKPVTPPKPPALAARELLKEQLNALPNTVVAVPRKPEEDPFDQVGLRAGAFVLRPALETAGGYDSNPGRVSGGKGSAFITPGGELNAQSNWQRHELTAAIRGSYTAYEATPELDSPFLAAKVASRVDVSERTRLLLEGRYLLTAANPATPGLQADLAALPIYTIAGATAGFAHRFNRLELAVKGTFDRTEWDNSKLTDGSTASNKGRDYDQWGVESRASYELTPGLKPFVDVAVDTRDYILPIDAGGVNRDSDGIAAKVGSSFEITRTLTGEAAIGYIQRTYKDPTLPDMRGVLVDASVLWVASGLTNVKLVVTTTPQETNLIGVSGILSYDTSLQVDHAFRRWLIGSVRLTYGFDDYVGSIRQDQRYAVGGMLTYKMTRTVQVKAEARHEWRHSNVPGNDYEATIGMVGLRWQP